MSTCREGYRLARNAFATISSHSPHIQTPWLCGKYLGRFTGRSFATDAVSAGQIPTLLYKTKTFASQVLRSKDDGIRFTDSSQFWEDVLTSAYDDYQSRGNRPVRLVGSSYSFYSVTYLTIPLVYGVDQWSCSEELVTALLSEPLVSDEAVNEVVRNRHHDRPKEKPLNISCVCSTFND